jgi:hypothetical protein
VDIAGALANGLHHDRIDDADDRRILGALEHLVETDILLLLGAEFNVALADILQDVLQPLRGLLGKALQGPNLLFRRDHRLNLQPGQRMHLLQPNDVEGVAQCDRNVVRACGWGSWCASSAPRAG